MNIFCVCYYNQFWNSPHRFVWNIAFLCVNCSWDNEIWSSNVFTSPRLILSDVVDSEYPLFTLVYENLFQNKQSQFHYFLNLFAQTKKTLFIFVYNWMNKGKIKFSPNRTVFSYMRAMFSCNIMRWNKVTVFFLKYISTCSIYTVLIQFISLWLALSS